MPFVKLDCGILNSSLWVDRDMRSVFITGLMMAEFREFLEPVPQISVRSLELTGWCAPAGWYGFIPAAGTGIVRRDGIDDTAAGLDALEALGNPDPDSRSKAHDGRRMIRIDGGYIVLNYAEYRDRDYGAADRMKRYRDRQRQKRDVTRNGDASLRNVTQAEAELQRAELQTKDLTTFGFASTWTLYPKRAGGNSRADALKCWNARVKAGVSEQALHEGVVRYATYCVAMDKVGTEYVKQARTFFGPNRHWEEPWDVPPKKKGKHEIDWNQPIDEA